MTKARTKSIVVPIVKSVSEHCVNVEFALGEYRSTSETQFVVRVFDPTFGHTASVTVPVRGREGTGHCTVRGLTPGCQYSVTVAPLDDATDTNVHQVSVPFTTLHPLEIRYDPSTRRITLARKGEASEGHCAVQLRVDQRPTAPVAFLRTKAKAQNVATEFNTKFHVKLDFTSLDAARCTIPGTVPRGSVLMACARQRLDIQWEEWVTLTFAV